MKRRVLVALWCVVILFSFAAVAQHEASTITETELVRRTQQLYDSLPSGDRVPWTKFYADDAVVYDEKGRSMNKKALLADIDPSIRIFNLDTGYQFAETLDLRERIKERYGIEVEYVRPETVSGLKFISDVSRGM